MKAIWNEHVIADTDDTVVVEGNHYFPLDAVDADVLRPSDHKSFCPWKGSAAYYHLEVGGQTNENAAWFYSDPFDAATNIQGRIAFWKGVKVTD